MLRAIRNGLRTDHKKLAKMIKTPDFLDYFGELSGELVKTSPQGFKKNDPGIDLIRKKSFHFYHNFSDKEVFAPDFEDRVIEGFAKMTKINHFLNKILDNALAN